MEGLLDDDLQKYYKVCLEYILMAGDLFRTGFKGKVHSPFQHIHELLAHGVGYDELIEDLIIAGVKHSFPRSKIIAQGTRKKRVEEEEKVLMLTDDPTWIIDPIDGTINFIKRIPHCCISVALSINKELVMGIVYNPLRNDLFTAWKGHGAYLNGQKITVCNSNTLRTSVVAHESPSHYKYDVPTGKLKAFYTLALKSAVTRSYGSPALTLCYIAKGIVDAYYVNNSMLWDIAAGAVILREAGGCLIGSDGKQFDIMKPNLVAACTSELCDEVLGLVLKSHNTLTWFG